MHIPVQKMFLHLLTYGNMRVYPFTGLDYWTGFFSFFGQVSVFIFRHSNIVNIGIVNVISVLIF